MKRCRGFIHSGFQGQWCGRELKTDEQKSAGLCANHLAGKKRSSAAKEKRAAESAANDLRLKASEAACATLKKLGIEATPHYDALRRFGSGYTGGVVIQNTDELIAALCDGRSITL